MDLSEETQTEFWSDTYRGHQIATRRDNRAWLVIINDVEQQDRGFETAEEAAAWLRRRVDAQAAEAIFPGLARS